MSDPWQESGQSDWWVHVADSVLVEAAKRAGEHGGPSAAEGRAAESELTRRSIVALREATSAINSFAADARRSSTTMVGLTIAAIVVAIAAVIVSWF
jgi:hypothetical protein